MALAGASIFGSALRLFCLGIAGVTTRSMRAYTQVNSALPM
jgi:hypothetical protein